MTAARRPSVDADAAFESLKLVHAVSQLIVNARLAAGNNSAREVIVHLSAAQRECVELERSLRGPDG